MNVIQRGTIRDPDRVWSGHCYNCASDIEALRKELDPKKDRRDHWNLSVVNTATCPVCQGEFNLRPKY